MLIAIKSITLPTMIILDKKAILELFANNLNYNTSTLTTNLEESDQIEFKQSLQTHSQTIDKQYMKPISAFANNRGGVLIFGVSPEKELKGIKDSQENLDNSWFSSAVRQNLDGAVDFTFFTHRYLGAVIGFLIIEEAKTKPIIVKSDAGEIKVGDIYFRYPAQSAKINAGDLRHLIMEEITMKTQRLLSTFQAIVSIGEENISLINTNTGEIQSTGQNVKLFLDESILGKLNLIRRGEFVSEDGAPAYIVKGEIEVNTPSYVEKQVPVHISDLEVIRAYLMEECSYPDAFVKRILVTNTFYQPIHFFTELLGKTSPEAIDYIHSIEGFEIKPTTKSKLIERLGNYTYTISGVLYPDCEETIRKKNLETAINESIAKHNAVLKRDKMKICRTILFNTLSQKIAIPSDVYEKHTQRCVEAFGHLSKEQVCEDAKYIKSELLKLYNLPMDNSTIGSFRKVICKFDDWLHRKSS
ncbi:MAG: hypothetical protein BGO21_16140 [Dyadobacter sp. 50-39]|nr:MAG: hypothetical protein BGO21_16140 [Dyadobacter sp. 50-39]